MKKWLAIICSVAVLLRIIIPAHAVFSGGVINFLGPDSYWRMNNARLLTESGHYGLNYDTLLAFMGNASIIIPVIFSVAVILMVYFMTRRLFNEKAGLFAAGFLALWPGEFMARTFLGAVDHHALESLMTTLIACIVFYVITQPRILSWRSLCGIAIVAGVFIAYKSIWPNMLLPVIDQPVEIWHTNSETMPLAQSANYIPQLTFVLACISGFILVKFYKSWRKWILLLWTAGALLLTIYQVRFDYYLVIPVAIMMGYWLDRMAQPKLVLRKVK
ncbi:MAG: glycosyltransferase family 39 protein [Bacteroidetes bacterium]|nr:glycosyltransferase family 39 protein [Bacteroidota bacterium]